jgi:pSer/pThr/pTyr-binding forkhead associated (FHA) protein
VPILTIEQAGNQTGLILKGRLLIGRRTICGVSIDHPGVSRIHAWIDRTEPDGYFYIADVNSRTGTHRNGRPITNQERLEDGDTITIGPATLRFSTADALPAGVKALSVNEKGTRANAKIAGILFACHCGAPMWVAEKFSGAVGHCALCHNPLRVPDIGVHAPEPTPRPHSLEPETCSVCQSIIKPQDETTACPSCGLAFHVECWHENRGCSAYGCPQVNVLDPEYQPRLPGADLEDLESETNQITATAVIERPPIPWEFPLLIGSVVGSLLGAVTFGAPAGAVAIAAVLYRFRRRHAGIQARVLAASIAVGFLGAVLGLLFSRFWWFNSPIPGLNWGRR